MKPQTFSRCGARVGPGSAVSLALVAALLALGASPAAMMAQEGNQGVVPPEADPGTYEELALEWWQWLIETPSAVNPVLQKGTVDVSVGQSGEVWFLPGNFGGKTVRKSTVAPGKALFFPIITYGAWKPTDGNNKPQLLATAKFYMDAVTDLWCSIDGVDVQGYRVVSDFGDFGQNDMTDVPLGSDLLVADGYWLLLEPLSPGRHVIEFYGEVFDGAWWLQVKYELTVEGE